MKTSCKEHPRYKAKRKPRCLCENCWRMWIENKDSLTLSPRDSDLFLKITSSKKKPNKKLKEAAKRYKRMRKNALLVDSCPVKSGIGAVAGGW